MSGLASGAAADGAATVRPPIGEEIYGELLSRILSSQIEPGGRITIDVLSRELGISQTPIREALHRLHADGVVVRTHLAGYRVAPRITEDQFESLVEIRLLLEPAAARHAAERMPTGELAELRDAAAAMRPEMLARVDRGYAVFSQRDADFHDAVARGGGNGYIRDSLSRLHSHIHLFRLSETLELTSRAIGEHTDIVDAIARRDPDGAAYAMRHHIEQSATRFRAAFR
ncbi:GntR family transcriptional regulator [Microbacterium ulmi]|uniref:GntR family transcriptional regulator n=1 Tax=Microbacterium ulmi TaxID=179095 RepID=A0A7Y2Q2D5_9MICO|nr:GntR family transcriptional regulator [Microbacterium ulmi]NII69266.1 DNA-binding GntR family transcriptional regulator [Microbacterium ulmi]NNH04945.1 GntR family transcriptional regulator [Microbacterium ulmi]